MKSQSSPSNRRGSALLVALILVGVLIALGASSFLVINNKYRAVHQAASWQEALLSAEAGVDAAVNEIRKNLKDYPSHAFEAGTEPGKWRYVNPDEAFNPSAAPYSTTYLKPEDKPSGITLTTPLLLRNGTGDESGSLAAGVASEGSTESYAQVTVDAPSTLIDDTTKEQWYRVRATGYCQVPGTRVAAGDGKDLKLRKFDFHYDHFDPSHPALAKAQSTRRVEAIVKPQLAFRQALLGVVEIDMTDHNIVVDSWDSANTAKYPGGAYPLANPNDPGHGRQWNGDIATDGTIINAGSAQIFGEASTNGGDVINSANVTGNYKDDPNAVRNDFYQDIAAVNAPTLISSAGTPTGVINDNTTVTVTSGSDIDINLSGIKLSGNNTLTINGPVDAKGVPLGTTVNVGIVVTGDVSLTGNSSIVLGPGVRVRLFVKGDTAIGGNGVVNPNSALNFQLYGVDRPLNADGTKNLGSIQIAGNGGYNGTVYAPNYNIELKGGGNSDSVYGSFVGNIVTMTGVQSVHYDEALGRGGLVTGYNVISWFEDER